MGRDHNEVRFELSRNGGDLFVRCADAWLERRDIAVGPVFQRKGLKPFHESPIPFRDIAQLTNVAGWTSLQVRP